MRPTRTTAAIAMTLALTGVGAACSGGDDPPATTTSTTVRPVDRTIVVPGATYATPRDIFERLRKAGICGRFAEADDSTGIAVASGACTSGEGEVIAINTYKADGPRDDFLVLALRLPVLYVIGPQWTVGVDFATTARAVEKALGRP